MAAIPRGADDILLDNIKTALETFVTEQVAEDPGVGFNVERDRVRMPAMRDIPLANIWAESDEPQRTSTGRLYSQTRITINIDCYAKGIDTDDDGLDDETAMKRLYYFKEQVRYALYRLSNVDFGFPMGTIAKKSWPTWRLFQNELRMPETEVVAGRWTFDVELSWTPEDISGTILDQITVDAGRWSAAYTYGGD